jgi:polysulfide reductase chain C
MMFLNLVKEVSNMGHLNWEAPIAIDLFTAAMGAGAFMLAVIAQLAGDRRYRTVNIAGAFIAPWPAILGVVLLVVDLGKPLRFWEMILNRGGESFFMFNLASTMSIGTWLMTIFIIYSLIYLVISLLTIPYPRGKIVRSVAGIIGLPFALLVTIYTGVLLSATSNSLWGTKMIPVLFVCSALTTGIAAHSKTRKT